MTRLLNRISVTPQAAALAAANLSSFGGQLTVPLALEFMAEVSSLVFPHRVLSEAKQASFQLFGGSHLEILCRAACREREELTAEVFVRDALGSERVLASGVMVRTDSVVQSRAPSPWESCLFERRRRVENAEELYGLSTERATEVPARRRSLRWAYSAGLGQLVGCIGPRGPSLDQPDSAPRATSPRVLEVMLELILWQWYALAGELGQVMNITHADWYRVARAEEDVLVQVSCVGTTGPAPLFNAVAYGPDRLPVIRLQKVALSTQRVEGSLPRLAWQSFVRALEVNVPLGDVRSGA